MADPTRPNPSHKKIDQTRVKNFYPDPSLYIANQAVDVENNFKF